MVVPEVSRDRSPSSQSNFQGIDKQTFTSETVRSTSNARNSALVYFYYIQYICPLIFLASIPTFVGSDGKYAFAMFALNTVFALIYIQHLHVIVNTMRYILKQITIPYELLQQTLGNHNGNLQRKVRPNQQTRSRHCAPGLRHCQDSRTKITEMNVLSLVGSLGMVFYCFGHGFSQVVLANLDNKYKSQQENSSHLAINNINIPPGTNSITQNYNYYANVV